MQYLTLALDASCDLPKAIYQRFDLATLPLTWLASSAELPPDDRSETVTEAWYQAAKDQRNHSAPDLQQDTHLSQLLEDSWLLNSDGALVITPAKHRHPGYQHWNHQGAILQPQLDRIRQAAHLRSHFRLRVMDSGHTLAAYGLFVQQAASLHRNQGLSIDKLRLPLSDYSSRIRHVYCVPAFANPIHDAQKGVLPGVNWVRHSLVRLRKRIPIFLTTDEHETLIGEVTGKDPIESVIRHATGLLEQNRLSCSIVNMSIATTRPPLLRHPAILRFHELVNRQGGTLWLSPMSGTSALLFGENALSVAFVN